MTLPCIAPVAQDRFDTVLGITRGSARPDSPPSNTQSAEAQPTLLPGMVRVADGIEWAARGMLIEPPDASEDGRIRHRDMDSGELVDWVDTFDPEYAGFRVLFP